MEAYIVKASFTTELFEQGLAHDDIRHSRLSDPELRLGMARKIASLDKPYAITKDGDAKAPRPLVFLSQLKWVGEASEEEFFHNPWSALFEYVATVPVEYGENPESILENYLETHF